MSLGLALYSAATTLAEPLAAGVLRGRARRGKEDAVRLGERLGRASRARPDGPLAWLHAASVGESVSILPLIERLRTERPDMTLLVTSGTVTSADLLARRLPEGAIHQYAPVDAPGAARRFLDHWRPHLAVFVESELWPNLLLGAKRRGAKLALLSARITEDSARGWRRAPKAARRLLGAFDLILAQDPASEARLRTLGASPAGVANLKLAGEPLPVDPQALADLRAAAGERRVVLAASTHEGEEEIIADAAPADALLVVVPRHPARGEGVAAMLSGRGLATARRAAGEPLTSETQAYVADTLGELGLFYRLADIAVIGGSLKPGIGGHNPMEPARLGAAIVTGPYVFNFTNLYADLAASAAAGIAPTPDALKALLTRLTPQGLALMGDRARAFANEQATALDDTWTQLRRLLP